MKDVKRLMSSLCFEFMCRVVPSITGFGEEFHIKKKTMSTPKNRHLTNEKQEKTCIPVLQNHDNGCKTDFNLDIFATVTLHFWGSDKVWDPPPENGSKFTVKVLRNYS